MAKEVKEIATTEEVVNVSVVLANLKRILLYGVRLW